MIESANVTILVNNWVDESRLWAEHGLSLLIEYREAGHRGQILLDVGQSGTVLAHNLSRLGLALDCLEYVVLSHGTTTTRTASTPSASTSGRASGWLCTRAHGACDTT